MKGLSSRSKKVVVASSARAALIPGIAAVVSAVLLSATAVSAVAQTVAAVAQTPAAAPPAGAPPTPASQAIAVRKAIYTLIGSNFKPIGDALKGGASYDSAELVKRATRVAYFAGLVQEAFPEASASGDTKAKPEIWSNRTDFDKRLKDFQSHAQALVQVSANEAPSSDAFKTAAGTLAQDCKGCHENYRAK